MWPRGHGHDWSRMYRVCMTPLARCALVSNETATQEEPAPHRISFAKSEVEHCTRRAEGRSTRTTGFIQSLKMLLTEWRQQAPTVRAHWGANYTVLTRDCVCVCVIQRSHAVASLFLACSWLVAPVNNILLKSCWNSSQSSVGKRSLISGSQRLIHGEHNVPRRLANSGYQTSWISRNVFFTLLSSRWYAST